MAAACSASSEAARIGVSGAHGSSTRESVERGNAFLRPEGAGDSICRRPAGTKPRRQRGGDVEFFFLDLGKTEAQKGLCNGFGGAHGGEEARVFPVKKKELQKNATEDRPSPPSIPRGPVESDGASEAIRREGLCNIFFCPCLCEESKEDGGSAII